MKQRTTAGLAAFALGSALVLAGCGSGDDSSGGEESASAAADASAAPSASPIVAGGTCEAQEQPVEDPPEPTEADQKAIKAVEVTGEIGKKPKEVSFETPFTVEGLAIDVLDDGDGTELADGDLVTIQDYVVNGEDGEALPSTWDEGQQPQEFTLGDPQFQVLNEPLTGLNVGARLTIAMVAQGGVTTVHVVDVVDSETQKELPQQAQGEPVDPEDGLPTVELADDGAPTVTIADDYEEPSELVIQPLIKGDGKKVTQEDEVTVQYLGCLLDGESFDSSWGRGTPTSFPLTNVVKGWTEGLDGQTVGSQVLLVVPPADAYGEDPAGHQLGGKTLIFVVDILDAKKAEA